MKNPKITLTKDGLILIDAPELSEYLDKFGNPHEGDYEKALSQAIDEGVKFKDEDKEFILNLIIPPMKGDVSAFQAFLDGKKMLDIPAGYRVSLEYYAKLEPLS